LKKYSASALGRSSKDPNWFTLKMEADCSSQIRNQNIILHSVTNQKPTLNQSMHTFINHTCFTHFANAKWKPFLLHKCEVTTCSSSGKVLLWTVWTELMWLSWTPQACSDVIRSFLVITVLKYMYKYFMRVETWC
jgi:hypothetical protein